MAENALRKCRAVDGEAVLGVDTAVVLDGRLYGKPSGESQAREWLARLSGREHDVRSAIALRRRGAEQVSSDITRVRFRPLAQVEIDWYVRSGEWRGRAGGYAVQGRAAALVDRIDGDFWTVVGLPVRELVHMAPDLVTSAEPSGGGAPPPFR